MDWTNIGVTAFFLYPFLIIFYDIILKFVIHKNTITTEIQSTKWLTYFADFHMIVWTILLYLHFTFHFFWG